MPAVWPLSLPQTFQADGFREKEADNKIRSRMDAGPRKLRRRFTAGIRHIDGVLWVTTAQLAVFKDFYRNTLKDGSLTFTMLHPVDNTEMTCGFREDPSYETPGGDLHYVSCALEVLP